MYEAAHILEIPHLTELASYKFELACKKFWKDEQFIAATEYALKALPESDRGLREILGDVLTAHQELLEEARIEAIMFKYSRFSFIVVSTMSRQMGGAEQK